MRFLAFILAILIACESQPPGPPEPLNINQATEKQLEALPGIGPVRARSIIASRNARGGMFTTMDDLLQIDGIGQTTIDRISPLVILGPPNPKKKH
jgi:competence protein ComEA